MYTTCIWYHCKSSAFMILSSHDSIQRKNRRIRYSCKKRNLLYKHICMNYNLKYLINESKSNKITWCYTCIGVPVRYFLCLLTSVQQGSPAHPWHSKMVSIGMLCCLSHRFLHRNGRLDVELVQMFTFKQKSNLLFFCQFMN